MVRRDDDDPYLVVAADKGTASFSDIANEIALQRGFWMGDAFASGGSVGYDHKGMGITAKGAWEGVKRHFRELGTDIQKTPFSVVGIGDMGGDVFGNGMLLSRQIDRQKSLAERKRQTALDADKLAAQERWWAQMLESFTIEAAQTGYVIYMNHPWTRAKFQEGDTVQTSFRVAQVADTSDLAVRVWVNGVDRPRVADGDAVTVRLDAIRDRSFSGRLTDISESGSKRQEWGDADYFEAVVLLEDAADAGLLPGMSALVEVL